MSLTRNQRRSILGHYKKIVPKLRTLNLVWARKYFKSQDPDWNEDTPDKTIIASMMATRLTINRWCLSKDHGNCPPIFSDTEVASAHAFLKDNHFPNLLADVTGSPSTLRLLQWEELPRFELEGIPDMDKLRSWGADRYPYQFIISFNEKNEERGYRASWKNKEVSGKQAIRIPGEPWKALHEAQEACEKQLERLLT